ncbi:hypothetical protein ANCCAN_10742 [Ancylostoma caninum]|uniref:Uncharacterized protein n=1 Tax=Ancylostoma caninum TaxID=29170 RepID=A0A368GJ47_ANCCA|nr:hypothetical protein ANCCAN_10742 [Ancylostoma caninum]
MGEGDGGHWPAGKGEGVSKQFQPKKYKDGGQEWRKERKEGTTQPIYGYTPFKTNSLSRATTPLAPSEALLLIWQAAFPTALKLLYLQFPNRVLRVEHYATPPSRILSSIRTSHQYGMDFNFMVKRYLL